MSDIPRETKGDARQGIPWQIIYASFMGVALCALLFYTGVYLWNGDFGWQGSLGGGAAVAVSIALATSFVALMVGSAWAVSVCRIATMAGIAVVLASFAWEMVLATRAPEWKLPGASVFRLTLDAAYQPRALTFLVGVFLGVGVLWLLLGAAARKFFGR